MTEPVVRTGAPTGAGTQSTLAPGRLTVVGIVFFVVAAAAPLVGMTGAVPIAIAAGNGAAAPGAYVVVGIVLAIFGSAYAAMSRRVTNTGAFFAYVGRGLGPAAGLGSALVSLVAYVAIQLSIFGFFGALIGSQMQATFGVDLAWWAWSLIAWAVVLGLSVLRVDVGAKVLGVLMICELASLVVTAVAVMVQGGGPDGAQLGASFAPGNIFAGGFAGSAGIALAFAFASFIGFEATALYGEESRDPKRAVPRATYTAVAVITAIFAMSSWAVVSGLGSTRVVDEVVRISTVDGVPLANPAEVLFHVTRTYVGDWLATTMSWLVVSSLFAGLLAFQNSASRYLFALGRAGALPSSLARVNGRKAPAVASGATSMVTGVVIVVFAVAHLDPVLNLFYWGSGLAVLAIVVVEILVCAAVVVFFRREPAGSSLWSSVIAPVVAGLGLLSGLYLLASRFGLLAGTVRDGVDPTTQSWGLNATGWGLVLLPFVVFAVGMALGRVGGRSRSAAFQDVLS